LKLKENLNYYRFIVSNMSTSNNSTDQSNYLKKIVELTIEDDNFRRALSENLKDVIDSKRAELGFGYEHLSNVSREVLNSITSEEFDTLHNIFQKAQRGGIKPREMF
jgi:hypothetical protein